MRNSDLYYRAFKDYRKLTAEDAACMRSRKDLAKAGVDDDKLATTKYLCTIREDWVQAIEEGLPFVEKAVAEERQFIRSNGEVIPIEKVKRISKDTVEHLAKHSDLITHLPEDEDDPVTPDKLYMVEKLSDYAVYENRFLYMMLCYLNDFINFRLEKIEELRHTYLGELSLNKQVVGKKRKLTLVTQITDSRKDNEYPLADDASTSLLKRIKDCRSIVMALLDTDLMQQVSKSPMIKPPITKTNVLKMNNNFKRALALYDYIASYKGDGYTYEEVCHDHAPFNEKVADELAESVNLMTFLAYKYGNDLEDMLETAYKEEENRRAREEEQKLIERINRLKKRALESNKTMEEYMLLLEERNRQLEKDSEELQTVRQEVETLNRRIDELNAEKTDFNRRIVSLQRTIEEKELEIERLNQKYIEDMAALRAQHEQEKAALLSAAQAELEALRAANSEKISAMQAEFDAATAAATKEHTEQVRALTGELTEVRTQWESVRHDLEKELADVKRRTENLDADRKKLTDSYDFKMAEMEKQHARALGERERAQKAELEDRDRELYMIRAELDGIRIKQGAVKPSVDYTSRERFVELEEEFEAFKRFFRGQWKLTKRAIRKEVFSAAADPAETVVPPESAEQAPPVPDGQNDDSQTGAGL